MMRSRALDRLVAAGLAALGWGCAAGYPPSESAAYRLDDRDAAHETTLRKEQASRRTPIGSKDLEAQLFLTDAGKTLVRSMRAHGGWDAWVALEGGSFDFEEVRARSTSEGGVSPAAVDLEKRRGHVEFRLDAAGALEKPRSDAARAPVESGDDLIILSVPFTLVDPSLRREYLGVEIDTKTGETLEKIRFVRTPSVGEEFWFVVSFDRYTSIMKRVLARTAPSRLTLTFLGDLKNVGGVLLPWSRSVHDLSSLGGHIDSSRPDRTVTISDFRTRPRK
ncbi:MAG TPA: hypothetical protein VMT52_08530 [Planctomycetota bacterium]|nr:hypothetical protein [Planctomycetota bacterium]